MLPGAIVETRVDEIADGIYRLSTFIPSVAPPAGLTFNQFLIAADEPLLFHCGQRTLFASVSAAAAKVLDLKRLRWITFSHVEADECGSLNEWLAAAPNATAAHGRIGCNIWLNEMADRRPRALTDGEMLDLGGKRVRRIDTPHVPHNWDAGLIIEETTGTLFSSDLFTHGGNGPAMTEGDIVGPSLAIEGRLEFSSMSPKSVTTLRRLAELKPRRIAIMHGSSYAGDTAKALGALAEHYEAALRKAVAE